MRRRAFLAGLLATAAVPALPKATAAKPAFDIGEISPMLYQRNDLAVYGRSPAMDALPDLRALNAKMAELRALRSTWYGQWNEFAAFIATPPIDSSVYRSRRLTVGEVLERFGEPFPEIAG